MGILTFFIALGLLVANIIFEVKNKENTKIINPNIVFFGLWTFILFLAVLNLYGLYKPSAEAYFLIMLMLVFYAIGNCIFKVLKEKRKKENNKENIEITKNTENKDENIEKVENKEQKEEKFWNYSFIVILVLCIIDILLLLIDCYIVIKNYASGVPMWKIRRWRMETFATANNPLLNRRSFLEETFRNVIINPFETILTPIAAYYFFNKKGKKKYILVSFSLIILVLSSLAGGGGRLGYMYYFGCYLLSYVCMFKNNKDVSEETKQKYKKVLYILLILGVAVVILFTAIRTNMSFFKQVYKYFALPPTLLSEWLPKIKEVPHTYGMLTTFGVHSYFFRFLEAANLQFLIPSVYNNAYQQLLNAEDFIQSGFGIANAFVTPIYYFFIDGGYIFVCLASMVFGFLVTYVYDKVCKNIEIKSFIIYTLIIYGVFLTFMRIQTCIPSYIISYVLVFLIFKKDGINIKWMKKKN